MSAQPREVFGSRFGAIMTMTGVAVGLGNVWRFPYMVGTFGGAPFVLFYLAAALLIGVPALMTEYALGRHTRRGTVGAFAAGGFPFGRQVGWFFFCVVVAATAYYSAVIGWVLYHALARAAAAAGLAIDAAAILPPARGFAARSFLLQLACTGAVLVGCGLVLVRGLRAGIERASTIVMPSVFVILVVLAARSLTLPGAGEGVRWFILKAQWSDLTPAVMMAAIGQMVFSLSLGGTFMVIYGSYLTDREPLGRTALWTTLGDAGTAMLAGLAILPAVFALQMAPSQGPGLVDQHGGVPPLGPAGRGSDARRARRRPDRQLRPAGAHLRFASRSRLLNEGVGARLGAARDLARAPDPHGGRRRRDDLVRLAKEEEGVGISMGAHLAGVRSAMLMQNHGFLAASTASSRARSSIGFRC
jgi:SNF family Na+-dependent transporter